MLLLALMWGLSIPVTKLGLQDIPPLTLTALRFAVAVLLLLPVVFWRRVHWQSMPRLAAVGILGVGVGQVTQVFGIAATSASVGTILSATIPVFMVIFATVRLKQRVTTRQQIGLVIAFIGIAVVALGHGATADPAHQSSLWGVFWMLVSALCIAFYYVWSVELTEVYGAPTVAAWSTLFGFVALLPWAGWEALQVPMKLTAQGFAVAVYLGVAVSVAGLFLWLHILKTVPAGIAASVQYLQPVFGIGASAIVFAEPLGPTFLLGVLLILAGLALTMVSPRRAQ
ncbi:MAG: DMT family transporter [Proteobacteria bacterium]|nr:DMT family transporter [Pseudomonadota bacterium]